MHGSFILYLERNTSNEEGSVKKGRVRQIFDDRVGENQNRLEPYLQLGVERLLTYDELPSCLQTRSKHVRMQTKILWLDERQLVTVDPDSVISTFKCRIMASEDVDSTETISGCPEDDLFYVYEVVFTSPSSRRPALRSSLYRHYLASEHHKPQPPPRDGMKHSKFFLDLFVDDFGPYRNVYHSLGGVYLVIGNLPLQLRQLIRNIFLLGFVPFGARFDDFINPFKEEMLRLQDGIEIDINGVSHWIVAGMSIEFFNDI